MNVLSKEQVYRMAIEEIIDDSIKENNIDFSNFKKETIFDWGERKWAKIGQEIQNQFLRH